MAPFDWNWSKTGKPRVFALTALGTVACIVLAFTFDSYSFARGEWHWGSDPINDFLIPLAIAPPFFYFLLSKLRQLALAHDELMTVASTDSLTALLNRRAFTAMVDGYLERVNKEPDKSRGALLVVDIDHFKSVNDRFGHDCGDQALRLVADTIKKSVRDVDLVGRMGGEEFCVFLPGLPPDRIPDVAERIRLAVTEAEFRAAELSYPLSVSIGGAIFAEPADFSSLYRFADQWLYVAKENGRNRSEVRSLPPPRHGNAPGVPSVH